MLKKVFQYSTYPLIVGCGAATIIYYVGERTNYLLIIPPVLVSAAALVFILERILPYETNPESPPLAADITHYAVNYGIKQFALMIYAQLIETFGFFSNLWTEHLPLAVQVLLALIVIDIFLYAVHRWSHENDFLWTFHALHHSSEQLYWVNGEKRHPLHQILEGLPGITVVMLLGAPSAAVVSALAILALNMMLQHGNIDYRAGFLRYVFSVAELHRWHHVRDAERSKVNFGAWLILWDLIFKTYAYPVGKVSWDKAANEIGLEQPHPVTYAAQFLYPLRRYFYANRLGAK